MNYSNEVALIPAAVAMAALAGIVLCVVVMVVLDLVRWRFPLTEFVRREFEKADNAIAWCMIALIIIVLGAPV